MTSELEQAKELANINGIDVKKTEILLQAIEEVFHCSISKKYKIIFYLATTGFYSSEDIANIFNHSRKNINSDFNKNLGQYLKLYFELEDNERVGITSLRRIMFNKGYMESSGFEKRISQQLKSKRIHSGETHLN
ncbi:MAG: hypothetical protein QNJ33_07640 [Crocosphaera sp.]|nr:hypothetical protein [Crocosphaera sp.]